MSRIRKLGEAFFRQYGHGISNRRRPLLWRGSASAAQALLRRNGGDDDQGDDDFSLRVRYTIRKTLAEDTQESAATFYRPDGKLYEISGDADEDFQPDEQDELLVMEMTQLFKQGNVASWEAEDIVRCHGRLLRPYHVFKVLKGCRVNAGLAFAFFKWADMQPGYSHGVSTFNIMLKVLQDSMRYADMVEVSKEMDSQEVPKSVVTYKILLASFFQAGMLEEALETFSQMEKSETPPEIDDYTHLIKTMLAKEFYPVVPLLFDRLVSAGNIPDAYMHNAVISSYCNMARMEEALQMFEKMKVNCACDIFSYTILIDGFIKCHQVGKATELFLEMLEKGCLPGEDIFNLLFRLHASNGRVEQAVELFRKVVENGCQPTLKSYGLLLDTFASADNLQGAYTFYKEIIDKGFCPSVVACNALLSRLNKSGKTALALNFFEEIKKFPMGKPSAVTYNTMIELLGKIGKYEQAWNTFLEMKASGCMPCLITYNNLILRLGRSGALEKAFNLLEEMKTRGISPNQYTYCNVIEVLIRHKQLERAMHFLGEMRDLNLQPNVSTLELLIKCLWTSGNLPAAKRLSEAYPGVYVFEDDGRKCLTQ